MVLNFNLFKFILVILNLLVFLMCTLLRLGIGLEIWMLFLVINFIFLVNRIFVFFLLYEIVFLLIIFVIIVLGYNYERLMAVYLIIFYSFLFSSPVLLLLLVIDKNFLGSVWVKLRNVVMVILTFSFIVKFPVFGLHYWLPVAHVEASTIGSIILAGILLKIGGLGVYYLMKFYYFTIKFTWIGLRLLILIFIMLFMRDLKIIIAYSSIVHMTLVFIVIISGGYLRVKGRFLIIFYHGVISPLMFWVIGMLAWFKTRSLLVVKTIFFSVMFLFILFVLLILNMGFPPFIGFLREVFIIKAFVRDMWILCLIRLIILFRCYYNVYLYWCFNFGLLLRMKNSFMLIDLFIFLILVIWLNLYR